MYILILLVERSGFLALSFDAKKAEHFDDFGITILGQTLFLCITNIS